MQTMILYHPNSDHARLVEDYARDFERRKFSSIELISLESKRGADLAKLYDIVQYPALIVVRKGGGLVKHWEGDKMPLMDEVAGYMARP